MKRLKKKRLESAGWVVGDTAQFLQLTTTEHSSTESDYAILARAIMVRPKNRPPRRKTSK